MQSLYEMAAEKMSENISENTDHLSYTEIAFVSPDNKSAQIREIAMHPSITSEEWGGDRTSESGEISDDDIDENLARPSILIEFERGNMPKRRSCQPGIRPRLEIAIPDFDDNDTSMEYWL